MDHISSCNFLLKCNKKQSTFEKNNMMKNRLFTTMWNEKKPGETKLAIVTPLPQNKNKKQTVSISKEVDAVYLQGIRRELCILNSLVQLGLDVLLHLLYSYMHLQIITYFDPYKFLRLSEN